MRRIINIIFLIIILIGVYTYRDKIESVWTRSFNYYFPCKTVIAYSLGDFDTRFGISKENFLDALRQAEKIWETPINKELFKYEEDGDLKINLIYDKRQETTVQLKNMGIVVENDRTSYDSLKVKYDILVASYNKEKVYLDSKISEFERRRLAYEREVEQVNSKGGANKTTFNRLNVEKEYLSSQVSIISELEKNLNISIENLNALSSTLNDLARRLNLNVDRYKTIGDNLGDEFDEGVYRSDSDGHEIDIYQFENKNKLIRVLAHELGHALGLDHNDDSKAIMYRLNIGTNEKLTNTDISELKTLCGIE